LPNRPIFNTGSVGEKLIYSPILRKSYYFKNELLFFHKAITEGLVKIINPVLATIWGALNSTSLCPGFSPTVAMLKEAETENEI